MIGFGCWLAELTNGVGGANPSWMLSSGARQARAAVPAAGVSSSVPWWESLLAGVAVWVVVSLVLALVCLAVLLLWLSCRGRFIFLDNVVHDRAAITAPWSEYRTEASSLFWWSLGFFAFVVAVLMVAAAPAVASTLAGDRSAVAAGVAISLLLAVPFMIGVAYVQRFLVDFVVPLMFAQRITTTEAWRRFLPFLKLHPGHLALYGLFVLVCWVGVGISVAVLGLLTCCLLFVPLVIPYVGTVVLQPVYVAFRTFSLEYLAQLSPELDFRYWRAETPDTALPSGDPG